MSENGALLAATVYVYLPYHIATIYVRGAFAESVAWAVVPACVARSIATSRPPTADRSWTCCLSLLPFALLFLIQPGIAILFALAAFAVTAALQWRAASARWLIDSCAVVVGGLAVGALLYVPTICVTARTSRAMVSTRISFCRFSCSRRCGDLAQAPAVTSINFRFNWALCRWVWRLSRWRWRGGQGRPYAGRPLPTNASVAVFLGAAIVLTLLTFEIAAPLWKVLGVFVAYPWQLLAFVGLALAIVAGCGNRI